MTVDIDENITADTADQLKKLADTPYANKTVAAFVRTNEAGGVPASEAIELSIEQINEACGTNYTKAKLYDWRSGHRKCPPGVMDYMRREICIYLFGDGAGPIVAELLSLALPTE